MQEKRLRTIPVHALNDRRVHLAPARPGHLRQGRLLTLCGRLAVTELSPFAVADGDRCRTCFGKVDAEGLVAASAINKPARPTGVAKPKPAVRRPRGT
jgi:hypothetical protein